MAVTITIHPGATLDNPLTLAKLQAAFQLAYATLDAGAIETLTIGEGSVTAAKLASTLDLSGKTITLPDQFYYESLTDPATDAPDRIGQIGKDSSDNLYVAYGTSAGNWCPLDIATSIGSAPTRTGQLALVSGSWYLATGTSAASDWKPLATDALRMPDYGGDFDGVADKMTFFVKDTGGQLDLWYRRGTAAAQQLTGVASTGLASYESPDWDSGWTIVNKNTVYDLTSTGAGAFSDSTSKGDDTTGATDASGQLDFVAYRVCIMMIKPANNPPYKDYLVFHGGIPQYYNGHGAQIIAAGCDWVPDGFDHSLPNGDIDLTLARLYLRTNQNGVFFTNQGNAAAVCDWDEQAIGKLGDGTDECLLRILLWQ